MSVNIVDNADTLKCSNCNIVISEVLAFIRNKHDVMDNESLIRICISAFSEEDIDDAKKLLYMSTKTKQKIVSRRKDKKNKDLEDMIAVFKTTDPEQIPLFVAYDLHKLPPISFDHVDVTKLLKDLLIMQAEIKDIKSKYVTRNHLEEIKSEIVSNLQNNCLTKLNSEKRGCIEKTSVYAQSTGDKVIHSQCDASVTAVVAVSSPCPARTYTNCNRAVTPTTTKISQPQLDSVVLNMNKQKTMADMVKSNIDWQEDKRDENWKTVQRKRYRNRFVGKMGKACSEGNFKAAEVKIPLFISNVSKDTLEKDISEYIEKKTSVVVQLEKIDMKTEKPYNAFKLFVPKHKVDMFLEDDIWPEGISFRRFVFFKKGTNAT
ncbi:hypothetical protein K1T71_012497 [Dendrolimus kikuchii]|uniref:Uncharacterized protein n=1 Tax=Dendrolimus kikuchii TaxID=765133 RepID=A0ACC1CJG9_9NEOP|nr:hypothetical protein K1T71_012497 [Dendrolimus kikuchii]